MDNKLGNSLIGLKRRECAVRGLEENLATDDVRSPLVLRNVKQWLNTTVNNVHLPLILQNDRQRLNANVNSLPINFLGSS